MDASTAQALRVGLETLEGVERAVVDETNLIIWVHCVPDVSVATVRTQVDDAVTAAGIDPANAVIHLLTDLAARKRVRFAGTERILERGNHVRIRVLLEWDGVMREGNAIGENGELIELRTSAAAALDALEHVLGEPLGIRLVGVKQIKAFDSELMVVALYRSGGSPQRLVGSVSVGNDPRRAAAIAVLSALNRILGNYLSSSD